MSNMQSEKYISVFEYLGQPAGEELGLIVGGLAYNDEIDVHVRKVKTKKYRGKINLYPQNWLHEVFTNNQKVIIAAQSLRKNNLKKQKCQQH